MFPFETIILDSFQELLFKRGSKIFKIGTEKQTKKKDPYCIVKFDDKGNATFSNP